MTVPRPSFRSLDRADSEALLARNHVGRLAFMFHDQVDLEPIHYVYADGIIHGRTTHGTKIESLAHIPWVAFEADEIEALYRWRSVVVRGTVYLLDPGVDQAEYDKAVAALRQLLPTALTPADPTPERNIVFRIHVREITGRAATDR